MADEPAPPRPMPASARLGGLSGPVAVVVGLGGTLWAALSAPWFSWTEHALSDLGDPARETALLFNGSITAAAVLYLVFVWGVWTAPAVRTPAGRVGLVLLAAGALFLVGVAAVPIHVSPHFELSLGFFFSYPPGVIIYGRAERASRRGLLPLSLGLALTALVFGILQFTPVFSSQAIPELALVSSLSLWTGIVGLWLYRGELPGPPDS